MERQYGEIMIKQCYSMIITSHITSAGFQWKAQFDLPKHTGLHWTQQFGLTRPEEKGQLKVFPGADDLMEAKLFLEYHVTDKTNHCAGLLII